MVEDNVISQELGRALLVDRGIEVTVVANGLAALRVLDEAIFDLVLMDIQMPGLNGFEATEILRRNPRLDALPVIALTSHDTKDTRDACLAAGIDELVIKPIEPERLYSIIDRHLQTSSSLSAEGADTPSAAVVLSDLPGIDVSCGLYYTAGNVPLYTHLLQEFRRLHAADCEALKDLVARHRMEEAHRLVHTLKGVSGTLGITELSNLCRVIESALPDPVAYGDLEALTRAHHRALAGIARLPDADAESAEESGFSDLPWLKLMEEMRALLKHGNFRALNLLSSCRSHLDQHHGELAEELEERLIQFRFDDAIESLERIDAAMRAEQNYRQSRASRAPNLPLPLGDSPGEGNDHGAHDLQFSGWRGRHDR